MSGEQQIRRGADFTRPRDRHTAEHAIEQALVVLDEARAPSVDQLSDLADAIDFLSEGAFDRATDLATVAQQRRTLPTARRPENLARTLPDLKAAFETTRQFLSATPLK
jgi:hypothetical protein